MRTWFAVISCAFTLFVNPWHGEASRTVENRGLKTLENDRQALLVARRSLRRALDFTRSRADLFSPDREGKGKLLTHDEKLSIWTTWSAILDAEASLDAIRLEHRDFPHVKDKARKADEFSLANAAFLAGYRYALEFIAMADRHPALDTILNDAVPELGLPAGTFARFKLRFLNVAIATEFAALQVIDTSYGNGAKDLRVAINEDRRVIWEMGKGKGHELTLKNALAVVQKAGFAAWFPVQKGVSEWMGDTKVHRKETHLISAAQVDTMKSRLQPGDILFERHEWYLSNMGLPGFWTHVALYVGTPQERQAFFNDHETREWVKSRGIIDGDFEKLLRKNYPLAYNSATSLLEKGHSPRILEAISEGVSFTSLEYSGASDSIGVIRPRLTKADKARALLRAFHYSGRPYDFNFDFATDSALVCSELVFKAYEPGQEMRGLRFPVTTVMGRKVSTPNEMVRQFDRLAGTGESQTDFVLFLDGFEKEKRAVESTVDQFRKSWQRPNWHILIQDAPVEARQGK
jgi:hypothetical protein